MKTWDADDLIKHGAELADFALFTINNCHEDRLMTEEESRLCDMARKFLDARKKYYNSPFRKV